MKVMDVWSPNFGGWIEEKKKIFMVKQKWKAKDRSEFSTKNYTIKM